MSRKLPCIWLLVKIIIVLKTVCCNYFLNAAFIFNSAAIIFSWEWLHPLMHGSHGWWNIVLYILHTAKSFCNIMIIRSMSRCFKIDSTISCYGIAKQCRNSLLMENISTNCTVLLYCIIGLYYCIVLLYFIVILK